MARKLAPDKWLFAATTGLALFGMVMVYSASAVLAAKENGNQFYYVLKQGVWVFIGFMVMLLMMQFNYQQLRTPLDQIAGRFPATLGSLEARADYFSRVLPRETRRRRRRFVAHLHS